MRIGELARKAGIGVDTVRYYEKAGLLEKPPRLANGYRSYNTSHLQRLQFVRHCRALDMALEDVRRLLALMAHPEADGVIEGQLRRVRARIEALTDLEHQLEDLRQQCSSHASVSQCGIVHELNAAATGDDQDEGEPGR